MTFTYDPTNQIGKVRRLVGDTDEATSEVTDEEIEAWLFDFLGYEPRAAVAILRSIAAKYSRKATLTSGNETITLGAVAGNLRSQADALEASFGLGGYHLSSQGIKRV